MIYHLIYILTFYIYYRKLENSAIVLFMSLEGMARHLNLIRVAQLDMDSYQESNRMSVV